MQPAASAQFDLVNLDMKDVSTLHDHRGEHVLTAQLRGGGSLQWQGKGTLAPLESSGSITLKDAKLAAPWQFARDHLAIAEPAGSYELGLRYRLRQVGGALDLQADDLTFRMKDVEIVQQQGGAALIRLATVAFEGGSFDLRQRSLAFKDTRITGGALNVTIDEEGTSDWAGLVTSAADSGQATAAPVAGRKSGSKAGLEDRAAQSQPGAVGARHDGP